MKIRDQAEKNGFMPLSEFAKEKSPTAAADDPWERPRTSSRPNAPPAGAPKPMDASKDNPFGESKPVNKVCRPMTTVTNDLESPEFRSPKAPSEPL